MIELVKKKKKIGSMNVTSRSAILFPKTNKYKEYKNSK